MALTGGYAHAIHQAQSIDLAVFALALPAHNFAHIYIYIDPWWVIGDGLQILTRCALRRLLWKKQIIIQHN